MFKAVECPVLKTTIANGKVTSCGKFYRETCTFTCNENYHIVNEAATSKKLHCLIDGHWSEGLPSCVCKKNFILWIEDLCIIKWSVTLHKTWPVDFEI